MAQQMLDLMNQWRQHGGNRLDLNNDGLIDYPGAAIMDAAYPNIVNNEHGRAPGQTLLPQLDSSLSRFDAPPAASTSAGTSTSTATSAACCTGRARARRRLPDQFNLTYCGKGHLSLCRSEVWNAIQAAGNQLANQQGPDPAAWRASATAEQIHFSPLPLLTMPYTNRPSGIQQVISFKSKRLRAVGCRRGRRRWSGRTWRPRSR